MMSSETSTDAVAADAASSRESSLEPWQLFAVAGLLGATVVVFVARGQSPAAVVLLSLAVFASAAIGATALRVFLPLATGRAARTTAVVGGRTRAALEREKALALRSIKELEFDRAMGKVSDQDFAEMSARLRQRAGRLLRQLDAGVDYRQQIEREIAQRLGPAAAAAASAPTGAPAAPCRACGVALEPGARFCTGCGLATATSCASCGTENSADAKFCKSCGARMHA
jgi:hypothetical protein